MTKGKECGVQHHPQIQWQKHKSTFSSYDGAANHMWLVSSAVPGVEIIKSQNLLNPKGLSTSKYWHCTGQPQKSHGVSESVVQMLLELLQGWCLGVTKVGKHV